VVAAKDSNESKNGEGAADPEKEAAKARTEAKKAASDAARAKAKKAKEDAAASSVKIAAPGETKTSPSKTPRLKKLYQEKAVPALMKEFQYKNSMQVPRLSKVVVNCAVKDAAGNPKVLDGTFEEILAITGQKPVITRAKKAIAAFKVRAGNPVGVMVTLRRARMYEFLDRFVSVSLPRVRDFKGVNEKSFDGRGNYTLGVTEQIIFPEIDIDKVSKISGMDITFVTTATTNEEAYELLRLLGMPFKNIKPLEN
jgi:large subunit ribosomal protein L5